MLRAVPRPDERGDQDLDEDLDLPPATDGGDGDGIEGDLSDLLDALDDGGDDPLDDREADIDPGVELDTNYGGEDDDRETDVGPLDEGLLVADRGSASDEEQGISGDDGDDLIDGESLDDGGDEGTGEPIEDAVDESLFPPLDEDEPYEEDIVTIAAEPPSMRWSVVPWSTIDGAGAVLPCRSVAVGLRSSGAIEGGPSSGLVAASGEILLLVEEGGHAARSAGHRAIAAAILDGDAIIADAQGKIALIPRDGSSVISASSWDVGPCDVEIAPARGRAFVRAGGGLHALDAPGSEAARPLRQLLSSGVRAIAAIDAGLLALVDVAHDSAFAGRSADGDDGPSLATYRGDDDGWSNVPLTSLARRVVERSSGPLSFTAAASGRAIAIANGSRAIVSRDSGATFEELDVEGSIAIAFRGSDEHAPLLVLMTSSEGSVLVEAPADGDPVRLADLPLITSQGTSPPTTRAAAIAWDSARDVVWVASPSGLIAVGPARRH